MRVNAMPVLITFVSLLAFHGAYGSPVPLVDDNLTDIGINTTTSSSLWITSPLNLDILIDKEMYQFEKEMGQHWSYESHMSSQMRRDYKAAHNLASGTVEVPIIYIMLVSNLDTQATFFVENASYVMDLMENHTIIFHHHPSEEYVTVKVSTPEFNETFEINCEDPVRHIKMTNGHTKFLIKALFYPECVWDVDESTLKFHFNYTNYKMNATSSPEIIKEAIEVTTVKFEETTTIEPKVVTNETEKKIEEKNEKQTKSKAKYIAIVFLIAFILIILVVIVVVGLIVGFYVKRRFFKIRPNSEEPVFFGLTELSRRDED